MSTQEEKALASASQNGGTLIRRADGFWQGKDTDPLRHDCSVVFNLVQQKKLSYTKAKDGTKDAWVEVKVV